MLFPHWRLIFPILRQLDKVGLTDLPIMTGAQLPLTAIEAGQLLKDTRAYTNTCLSFYDAKGGEVRKVSLVSYYS